MGDLYHPALRIPLITGGNAPGIGPGEQQSMAVVSERFRRVVP